MFFFFFLKALFAFLYVVFALLRQLINYLSTFYQDILFLRKLYALCCTYSASKRIHHSLNYSWHIIYITC